VEKLIRLLSRFLPSETYLVGGFVRDYLLQRGINDIDLTLRGNPEYYARLLAGNLKGSLFGFKKEGVQRGEVYTVLIPFEGKKVRVDLSAFENLAEDLAHRDFTVNAMAWKLSDFPDKTKIVDPFGGLRDLKRGIIRAVSPEVLEEDPLRTLRAYRIAQGLGFEIEPATREFIRQRGELVKTVATERVLNELLKIFAQRETPKTLSLIREDSFDRHLFGFEISQSSLKGVELFETLLKEGFTENLKRELGFGERTFLGEFDTDTLLKLAVFLYPSCRWEEFLKLYPLGEDASKFLKNSLEGFESLLKNPPEDLGEKHRYLKRFSKYLYPIGILSKIYGNYGRFEELKDFYKGWRKFSKPLLDGREVMNLLGLKPSPLVGELLEKLVLAQLRGEVSTPQEAKKFLKKAL